MSEAHGMLFECKGCKGPGRAPTSDLTTLPPGWSWQGKETQYPYCSKCTPAPFRDPRRASSDPSYYDPINPPHYSTLSPEPIAVVEGWDLGYNLGSVIKYIARAGRKDPTKLVEDLEKARWHLDRYIERLKNERRTA